MKQCSVCKQKKPHSEFYSCPQNKDGFRYECKICGNKKNLLQIEQKMTTKKGHLSAIVDKRKREAKKRGIPFSVTLDYLESIATDTCPVFGIKLSWGVRKGASSSNSPSLDKIKPELGYVEGNVAWISYKANTMKSDATLHEVESLVNWMKSIENQ
jgi:hypothetical protein